MLASLLLNLGKAGNAIFTIGARLTFRPHAPEITTEYESEQWANPTGRAPNQTLDIVLDRPGIAQPAREKRIAGAGRQVEVYAEWHAQVAPTGARVQIRHWAFDVNAGQTIELATGARAAARTWAIQAEGAWAAAVQFQPTKTTRVRAQVPSASAGATATFREADFNQFLCNPPEVRGIRNPSPAEIIAMVHAAMQ